MKHLLTGVLVSCGILASCTQKTDVQADYQVIPLPQEITSGTGDSFVLNSATKIVVPAGDEEMQRNAQFLADYVAELTGNKLAITDQPQSGNAIILSTGLVDDNKEAYMLTVDGGNITIDGASPAGVFYGIQTLRKSIPAGNGEVNVTFAPVQIQDEPRFAYRGAHLDVCRHFFPVDSVKKFIDMIALHNINRFHWHISEDQGWRIEIKSRPELTEKGSIRQGTQIARTMECDTIPYGGFYTQDEARDIVKYAADRYITVIPEIDLPGHMQAALACYPELGCTGGPYEVRKYWGVSEDVLCPGTDETFKFLDDVLGEIVEIFPSQYIHIGGDECPKVRWKDCPKCQAKIKELGIKGDAKHSAEEKLQSYVINHVEQFLNGKGRSIIGWDEILEGGLAPNATVMSWRGEAGGIEAAKQHHDVIMTPNIYLYFDYYQTQDVENEPLAIGGYVPVEMVYNYEPMPASLTDEEKQYIKGVQANTWTEFIDNYPYVEYMDLPRMAALSEVQWTDPSKKNYDNFLERLPQMLATYDQKGYNYARHLLDVKGEMNADPTNGTASLTLTTLGDAPIYYTLDGSEPTEESTLYTAPVVIDKACEIKAVAIRPNGVSRVFTDKVVFNKATNKPISLLQPTDPKYTYKGAALLNDGLVGNSNYASGRWVGFCGSDMEAVIDLGEPTEISSVAIRECVAKNSWIFGTRQLAVSVSDNGKDFTQVASEDYPQLTDKDPDKVTERKVTFDPVKAQYVKVLAVSEHALPAWHWGAGKPGLLFVDEIVVD